MQLAYTNGIFMQLPDSIKKRNPFQTGFRFLLLSVIFDVRIFELVILGLVIPGLVILKLTILGIVVLRAIINVIVGVGSTFRLAGL